MIHEESKNWVWCEDCLEWKDAGNEVSILKIEEDTFGKEVMTFACDKCENENENLMTPSATKPKGSTSEVGQALGHFL
jgi:Zn finger protein HypA/HybF involved in hydrogenase expression